MRKKSNNRNAMSVIAVGAAERFFLMGPSPLYWYLCFLVSLLFFLDVLVLVFLVFLVVVAFPGIFLLLVKILQ